MVSCIGIRNLEFRRKCVTIVVFLEKFKNSIGAHHIERLFTVKFNY